MIQIWLFRMFISTIQILKYEFDLKSNDKSGVDVEQEHMVFI